MKRAGCYPGGRESPNPHAPLFGVEEAHLVLLRECANDQHQQLVQRAFSDVGDRPQDQHAGEGNGCDYGAGGFHGLGRGFVLDGRGARCADQLGPVAVPVMRPETPPAHGTLAVQLDGDGQIRGAWLVSVGDVPEVSKRCAHASGECLSRILSPEALQVFLQVDVHDPITPNGVAQVNTVQCLPAGVLDRCLTTH